MPSFIVVPPKGKAVDITDKIKKATSEDDMRDALVDAFRPSMEPLLKEKGMPPKKKARGE